jgi:hypothetical protein
MKKDTPQYIYNLFVYPKGFMTGCEILNGKNSSDEQRKKFKDTPEWYEWLCRGTRRATFLEFKSAEEVLTRKQDLYTLHEGYYEYALIEKICLNEVDGWYFGSDAETWYRWNDESSSYNQIKKPEYLKGTCCFT